MEKITVRGASDGAFSAPFPTGPRAPAVRGLRYDWLLGSVPMDSVSLDLFASLCGFRDYECDLFLIDPKPYLIGALKEIVENLGPRNAESLSRDTAFVNQLEAHIEVLAGLTEVQCMCLLEHLQEVEDYRGPDHNEFLREAHRRMQARATPEGREVVRLRAELEWLRR